MVIPYEEFTLEGFNSSRDPWNGKRTYISESVCESEKTHIHSLLFATRGCPALLEKR